MTIFVNLAHEKYMTLQLPVNPQTSPFTHQASYDVNVRSPLGLQHTN